MKKLMVVMALVICASAQDLTRSFELKYANPDAVRAALGAYPASSIVAVNNLHILSVRASKEMLDLMAEVIKKLDVPPPAVKNIEFTGYMIFASSRPPEGSEPPELANVVKQLKGLFPFTSYRVGETFFLRSRDGQGARTEGTVLAEPNFDRRPYEFIFRTVTTTGPGVLRVDGLQLHVKMGSNNLGFFTDLDIHEGQKIVVGKSSMAGNDNTLILVLTAKIVE